jgi:hypothetical protein
MWLIFSLIVGLPLYVGIRLCYELEKRGVLDTDA